MDSLESLLKFSGKTIPADVLIIGGGSAGCMAAIKAKDADPGLRVAVMEKADNALVVKADLVWDDIGSWLALDRIKEKDRDHNVTIGEARAISTYETTIVNDSEGIIATLGVSDLVIVKTDDIVFVAHKTKVQDVKELLSELTKDKALEKYL